MIKQYFELQKGMLLQNLDPDKTNEFARMLEIDVDHFLVYLTILQSGPLTVAKVAMKLTLDRGKTYRAVHKLQALGYVTESLSNPILVSAEDPEDIIKLLIDKHTNNIKQYDRIEISEFFEEIKIKKKKQEIIRTSYISGMDNYMAKLKLLLEECESAKMYLSQNTLKRIYYTDITDVIAKNKKKYTIIANDLKLVKRLYAGRTKLRKDTIDQDVIVTDKAVLFDVGPMNTTKLVNSFYFNNDDTNYMYTTNTFLIFIASRFLDSLDMK